jgi:hypothetical protein
MSKKRPPSRGDAEAKAIRELMQKLRTNEKRYLEQAKPGGLPTRRDVIEANIQSLIEMRRAFAKLGGFQYANLPVHQKILLDELGTVLDGSSSRLFSTKRTSSTSNQVTSRTRYIRAHSAIVVDLLMDKKLGPGWLLEASCQKVAKALEGAGFGPLSWQTIRDWRKEARSPSSQPTFQIEYDVSKPLLTQQVRDGQRPEKLLEELPTHIRTHLYA